MRVYFRYGISVFVVVAMVSFFWCVERNMSSSTPLSLIPETNLSVELTCKVLLWDFHDVIVRKQPWVMAQSMWNIFINSPDKVALIGLLIKPSFWFNIDRYRQESDVLEEVFCKAIKDYPVLKNYENQLIELINLHTPIPEMVDLLKKLKMLGYRHFIASNIGKRSYALMLQRYPALFGLFEDAYYVGKCTARGTLYSSRVKPYKEYYQGLRLFLKDRGIGVQENVIFIDDKNSNIKGAQEAQVNLEPLLFITPENIQYKLEQKGIRC